VTTVEKPMQGWKVIARAMELNVKSCRRLAWRRWDPLPVLRFEGTVLAYASALGAWKDRNTLPLQVACRLRVLGGRGQTGPSGPTPTPQPRKIKVG
jgi:hypothetical protein